MHSDARKACPLLLISSLGGCDERTLTFGLRSSSVVQSGDVYALGARLRDGQALLIDHCRHCRP